MFEFSYVLIRFVSIFFDVLLFAMLGRAICSWFMQEGESPLLNFLFIVTEPVILPLRMLCAAFGWFEGVPLDMPFMMTAGILSLASMFLEHAVS